MGAVRCGLTFMWMPYSLLLPPGILSGNRKQQVILQEESQNLDRKTMR